MKGKVFGIPNAKNKVNCTHFAIIHKYSPGILHSSDLPIPVVIEDIETKERTQTHLVEVLPFTNSIPTVLCLWAEGKEPEDCVESIFERTKTKSFNQLALYVYATI